MTVWGNGESLCHKAREFYYEVLRHNDAAVPEAIARHIEGCAVCREQIRRLQEALTQAQNGPDSPQGPRNNEAIGTLSRHFEFLGERIYCSQVKAFLPDLLSSSRPIRIPTPITVHVDNCPACGEDLASIRELGLRAEQLGRLGLFYSQAASHNPSQCSAARPVATGLAAFSLDGADPRALNEVSRCPECRAWLYRQRAQGMAEASARARRTGVLACDEISMADVFDFVVPFGLDATAIARTSGRRDAVATHVRACPQCVEKVQSLHRTLYAIAERADSAVCTVCRVEEDGANTGGQTQADVHRYPLHVQVLRQEPAPAAVPYGLDESRGSREAASVGWQAAPRRKILLAAAAVLVGGVLTMIPHSTATGMNVEGVRRALGRMKNVYVVRSSGEDSAPFFEMLLAADRQIVVKKIGEQRTIYDFDMRQMTVFEPGQAPRAGPLSVEDSGGYAMFLKRILEQILADVSEKDDFAEREHVASDRPGEYWSVYELTRTSADSDGAPLQRQWRVFYDPIQQLPAKIEYVRQPSFKSGPPAVQVTEFRYLSRSAMDSEITAMLSAP